VDISHAVFHLGKKEQVYGVHDVYTVLVTESILGEGSKERELK